MIAWLITLLGMFFLSNTFRILADKRPDLKAGTYRYAQEGFGPLADFQMAWGFRFSSAFGNVAGGSVLIWTMHFTVLCGVKRAAGLNVFASIVNIDIIVSALVIMAVFVHGKQFSFDVWGQQHLGSVLTQVKSTMLVTLWVFLAQVGTATFVGLAICTVLYFLLSALPFGVMHQKELAGLRNPSTAYVLRVLVGRWGAVFVNMALLLSTLFCWLAWTILAAELPFERAKGASFPNSWHRRTVITQPPPRSGRRVSPCR